MARVNTDLTSPDGNVRTGWRHMLRDRSGTVIAPGGNVIHALDALCDYEDICEAAGIHGPEELRRRLACVQALQASEGPAKHKEGRHRCGDCGHWERDSGNRRGSAGHCTIHQRAIRSGAGRKGSLITVQGEPRACAAARPACRDWTEKKTPPQWVGPSAELLPEY